MGTPFSARLPRARCWTLRQAPTPAPCIQLQPWMTARDRELWDALVFDAYDNSSFISEGTAIEDRRTAVIRESSVPTILVCIEPGVRLQLERVAPVEHRGPNMFHVEPDGHPKPRRDDHAHR